MKILVLNGSPRPQGNTAKMVSAFQEAAAENGHVVTVIDVCRRNIRGCLACEYCHGRGRGACSQQDDMQEMYVGAKFSFDGDFLGYLGLENAGFFTCAGNVKASVLEEIRAMARSLA